MNKSFFIIIIMADLLNIQETCFLVSFFFLIFLMLLFPQTLRETPPRVKKVKKVVDL